MRARSTWPGAGWRRASWICTSTARWSSMTQPASATRWRRHPSSSRGTGPPPSSPPRSPGERRSWPAGWERWRSRWRAAAFPGRSRSGSTSRGPGSRPARRGPSPRPRSGATTANEGREVLARGRGAIRMLTLAPEVAGAADLLEDLGARGRARVARPQPCRARRDRAGDRARRASRDAPLQRDGAAPPPRAGSRGRRARRRAADGDLICDGAHVHPRWCAWRRGRSASGWC